MFGRKRKEEDENLGLSAPFVTPSASVAPTANPTAPATGVSSPPSKPIPRATTPAGTAPIPSATTPAGTAPIAMLGQILSGNGPVGEMIAQIKADPEAFRQRVMQQAQAAGVSTYVLNPQWMGTAAQQHVDVVDELTKAAALHDKGVLTDAEFETLKKKLLAEE